MARLHEFANPEGLENFKQRRELARRTGSLHDDRFLCHVHHAGAEDIYRIHHLRAVGIIGRYLHQHDGASNGGIFFKFHDLDNRNELIELLRYLLNDHLRGIHNDGQPVNSGGFRVRGDQGHQAVATAAKHSHHAGDDAFYILN